VSNLFHYVTPAALVRDTDFAGGQRVYNGRRDIGAGEADWRPQYAVTLGVKGRSRVTTATTSVVETAAGVTLADAQELAVSLRNTMNREVDCEWQVTVPNGGTLTATVNGVTTTVPSGTFAHKIQVGANDVSFAYAGEGTAVLRHFRRLIGMAVIVR